eukprot:862693_1
MSCFTSCVSKSSLHVRGCDYAVECGNLYGKIYNVCYETDETSYQNATRIGKRLLSTPAPTCLSIDYAHHCLLGYSDIEACHDTYSGSGIIDIGYGVFNSSFPFDINDNQHITIKGKGPQNTKVNYNGEADISWFQCQGENSLLELKNVTLFTDHVLPSQRIMTANRAVIYFNHVIFDFAYFHTNTAADIWHFAANSTVIFNHCVFKQSNTKMVFDNSNATFINCTFMEHSLTISSDGALTDEDGMFVIRNDSNIVFEDCLLQNVHNRDRSLFSIYSGSLRITFTHFLNMTGRGTKNAWNDALFAIHSDSHSDIYIIHSIFEFVQKYFGVTLIHPASSGSTHVTINNTIFNHSANYMGYYGHANTELTILNTQYLNGNLQGGPSIHLMDTSLTIIKHCVWSNYTQLPMFSKRTPVIFQGRMNTADQYKFFDNITMKDIHGHGLHIEGGTSPITLTNSLFQNIQGVCVMMSARQQQTIKHTTFQNCSDSNNAALSVFQPDGHSLFESLTFIDNYSPYGLSAADAFFCNKGFRRSKLTIKVAPEIKTGKQS